MENITDSSISKQQFNLLIQVDQDMAPLQKKNRSKVHGIDENKLRLDGEKHIDLWEKGELFPIDPKTNLHPDFKSITGLVKYLCHGKQGLLGYCESLKGNYTEVIERNNYLEMRKNHLEMRNNHLGMMHYGLVGTINQLQINDPNQ